MDLIKMVCGLRQLRFPRAFRVRSGGRGDWAADLIQASPRAAAPEQSSEPSLPDDFAAALCNQYFRLRRNLDALETAGASGKEVRMCRRGLETISDLLGKHEITCMDLTGQEFADGRRDFEIVGEPETRSDIAVNTITYCERPAVLRGGKLIQAARGIVARPG